YGHSCRHHITVVIARDEKLTDELVSSPRVRKAISVTPPDSDTSTPTLDTLHSARGAAIFENFEMQTLWDRAVSMDPVYRASHAAVHRGDRSLPDELESWTTKYRCRTALLTNAGSVPRFSFSRGIDMSPIQPDRVPENVSYVVDDVED
ncbi:hypothetical protein E4U32_000234, partial [Claviceps aff. humidiphila group G2b]